MFQSQQVLFKVFPYSTTSIKRIKVPIPLEQRKQERESIQQISLLIASKFTREDFGREILFKVERLVFMWLN